MGTPGLCFSARTEHQSFRFMRLQAIYAFCKKDLLFLIMRCCFVNKRKVMGRKQRLLIILPEVMSDIQVQIVKGGLSKKLILDFRESEGSGKIK